MTDDEKEDMELISTENSNQPEDDGFDDIENETETEDEEQYDDQVGTVASDEQQDVADENSELISEAKESESPVNDEEVKNQEQEQETIVETDDDNDLDFEPTIESVIEAILFASDEPITPVRLAKITEISIKELKKYVKNLNSKYKTNENSFRIAQIAGGLQMMTLPPYGHWLKKLIRVRGDSKLSPAALETLAIVAYKQPIIRADVEAVRGVAAGEMIRSLMFKGLVKIAGRAEILGRPMLYGTTKKFLEIFGLNSLKDLPKIEELKKPVD